MKKALLLALATVALLQATACKDGDRTPFSNDEPTIAGTGFGALMFHEVEVRTRKWVDGKGQEMVLLRMETLGIGSNATYLLAFYGVEATRDDYCIDIYSRYPPVSSMVPDLRLLSHDWDSTKILQISRNTNASSVDFQIAREDTLTRGGDEQRARVRQYGFSLNSSNQLIKSLSEFLAPYP